MLGPVSGWGWGCLSGPGDVPTRAPCAGAFRFPHKPELPLWQELGLVRCWMPSLGKDGDT